jgi:hypothetical protein
MELDATLFQRRNYVERQNFVYLECRAIALRSRLGM